MSKLEKFYFFTAIFGLFSNLVAIFGIITGKVGASPNVSFILSTQSISILTIVMQIYVALSLKFYLLQWLKNRWLTQGYIPSESRQEEASTLFFYLTWTPIFLLWCVGMWGFWGMSNIIDDGSDPINLIGTMIFFPLVVGGGIFFPLTLTYFVRLIDGYINPKWGADT